MGCLSLSVRLSRQVSEVISRSASLSVDSAASTAKGSIALAVRIRNLSRKREKER